MELASLSSEEDDELVCRHWAYKLCHELQVVPTDDARAPNEAPLVIPKASRRISCSPEE